jgi:hypothetical protein
MSRKGSCWDNAVVESFISTLKLVDVQPHRRASHGTPVAVNDSER